MMILFMIVSCDCYMCKCFCILGALGVMYLEGFGVEKNMDKAFICLKDAARRGNVFAMGYLIAYYYRCKLFTKAMELAARCALCFCNLLMHRSMTLNGCLKLLILVHGIVHIGMYRYCNHLTAVAITYVRVTSHYPPLVTYARQHNAITHLTSQSVSRMKVY